MSISPDWKPKAMLDVELAAGGSRQRGIKNRWPPANRVAKRTAGISPSNRGGMSFRSRGRDRAVQCDAGRRGRSACDHRRSHAPAKDARLVSIGPADQLRDAELTVDGRRRNRGIGDGQQSVGTDAEARAACCSHNSSRLRNHLIKRSIWCPDQTNRSIQAGRPSRKRRRPSLRPRFL